MKIHHYTTIETLALILKNKAIRFNRLDGVDDLEESEYGISAANVKMGKYHFVSCWTKDAIENIALWGLYTKYKGVRISLDENMFVTYPINNTFNSYFPEFNKIGDNYLISVPNNDVKLIDVEYVDDLKSKINQLGIYAEDKKSGKYSLKFSNDFGTFKSKQWKFQKQSRFKISVCPIQQPDLTQLKGPNSEFYRMEAIMNSIAPSLKDSQPVSVQYFDIDLNEIAFQNIEILLAPQTMVSEKIIVESLIKSFCPTAVLSESVFKGKIRFKGTF